ncbi:hypothetical protein RclHR1_28130001 [Rhizophagus clarus]|uniref:Uncharacterized protein n=1 Tax=Rhizophagus clarus TaxID=94130 RepID=A0A2Z6R3Y2_9GLOM|nr:hypothetical protein RclHR1_28130001 [Rhizophagus clarus]
MLIPKKFNQAYRLNAADIGLVFLLSGFGLNIGSYASRKISDCLMGKKLNEYDQDYYLELRLYAAWIVAVNSIETYLVDTLPDTSTSVIALQNIIKSLVASTMIIIADPLDNSIGIGWTFTILITIPSSVSLYSSSFKLLP